MGVIWLYLVWYCDDNDHYDSHHVTNNGDEDHIFALVLLPLSCSSEVFTLSLRSIKRAVAGPDNSMFKFYKARSNTLNTSHVAPLPVRSRNWQIICSGKIQKSWQFSNHFEDRLSLESLGKGISKGQLWLKSVAIVWVKWGAKNSKRLLDVIWSIRTQIPTKRGQHLRSIRTTWWCTWSRREYQEVVDCPSQLICTWVFIYSWQS